MHTLSILSQRAVQPNVPKSRRQIPQDLIAYPLISTQEQSCYQALHDWSVFLHMVMEKNANTLEVVSKLQMK